MCERVARNEITNSKIRFFDLALPFSEGKIIPSQAFWGTSPSAAEVLLSALTFDLPKQLAIGGHISFGASDPNHAMRKGAQCPKLLERVQFQGKSHPST